ncbi:O-succinylbenzoic acid--CoA ligase [Nonlabens dokdonensis]|jgi:O-succinylbenzoic acid--CoA ligase|uniref:O-succinylbenzoic acid-CoA ligase n=2 Tax=Nonlabens dokdonensis TaxID=328515 RepID=L7W0U6_NONDD|nr:AMP-binding protein [Nonlabens dokdonensis]AGC75130.1 O-succinylbenzoic acid-CoA ligase [Nonlabens dokdonensis DSW-6]PZX39126.1 O-succinylbenzoic acid--CoA ligase [Nonlabens dokdonensis]
MIPTVHPNFKLNGHSLNNEGVAIVAYSYIKEGEEWEKQVGDFLLSWLDNYDVVTVRTSGSTGVPKEYKLLKEHMINSAIMTGKRFNIDEEKDALCCLPLSYIAGKMMLVRAMTLGWHLDLVAPSTTPLKKAEKRYDFTAMSPLQVSKSLDDIHKTRKVIIGGGAVSKSLIERLDRKHTKAYHTYGMTETCSHIAVRQLYPRYDENYTVLDDIKIEKDEQGKLVVHAPLLSKTSLVTNDLVELVGEKEFKVLGRVDDVINTGSVKVHPAQIEEKLSHRLTGNFFISGKADEDLGQKVVLIVEGDERDVQDAFKKLEKFEKPKEIFFVNSFDRTHTGKVDKRTTLEKLFSDHR